MVTKMKRRIAIATCSPSTATKAGVVDNDVDVDGVGVGVGELFKNLSKASKAGGALFLLMCKAKAWTSTVAVDIVVGGGVVLYVVR